MTLSARKRRALRVAVTVRSAARLRVVAQRLRHVELVLGARARDVEQPPLLLDAVFAARWPCRSGCCRRRRGSRRRRRTRAPWPSASSRGRGSPRRVPAGRRGLRSTTADRARGRRGTRRGRARPTPSPRSARGRAAERRRCRSGARAAARRRRARRTPARAPRSGPAPGERAQYRHDAGPDRRCRLGHLRRRPRLEVSLGP